MATINGTGSNDTLFGTGTSDTINGFGGDDILWGYGGNDRLDGGTGADTMYGGIGNDIYTVDNVGDSANENSGEGTADQVRTSLTSYLLDANVEKLLFTGVGSFTGTGNAESNEIIGGGSADTLSGGLGFDSLWGGGGNDILYGGDDDDMLIGEAGADTMEGNDGGDSYMVDNVLDSVVEQPGEGVDFIYAGLSSYTLPANVEGMRYNLWSGGFNGTGNALDNWILGGSGNDTLSGLDGNDELDGGPGADTLSGGDGDDLLIGGGGTGADVLTGGASSDTFKIGYYESGTGSGADSITDFESGIDLIDLSGWDADTTQPGDQSFFFVDDAPFENEVPGWLRAEYDPNIDATVIQGDINGDTLADFEIRLEGFIMVTSSDFLL